MAWIIHRMHRIALCYDTTVLQHHVECRARAHTQSHTHAHTHSHTHTHTHTHAHTPTLQVNLGAPTKTVLVQITRNVTAAAVVPRYRELHKYNLRKCAEVGMMCVSVGVWLLHVGMWYMWPGWAGYIWKGASGHTPIKGGGQGRAHSWVCAHTHSRTHNTHTADPGGRR